MAVANTLMKLLVKLGVDSADLDNGLSDAEKKSTSSVANIGSSFAMLGGVVTGAIGAAAAATTAFLASTIEPASDLSESMNAVGVVFGSASDAILDYGENAARTVGLSNREFNQLATTTGAFLQNVGFNADEAGQKTIELTERAADMASVFNTDVGTAMNAIQSALKGEFNPLEQFGVKLNAAAIEAKALQMGLVETTIDISDLSAAQVKATMAQDEYNEAIATYGTESNEAILAFEKYVDAGQKVEDILAGNTGEITDSAKAQAALALVMEQTDKTAGDFLNTSDGLANQQRIMAAEFENLKAQLGTALLPVLTALGGVLLDLFQSDTFQGFIDQVVEGLTAFSNWAIESIPLVVEGFQSFVAWLSENEGVVVAILTVLGIAVLAFGASVATAAWSAISPLLPFIAILAAIGLAVYLLYEAWTNNWGGIQEKLAAVWAVIEPVFTAVKTWLEENIPVALNTLSEIWEDVLLPAIQAVGDWMEEHLFPLFEAIAEFIDTTFNLALTALAGLWENVLAPALETAWEWLNDNILPILQAVGDYISITFGPAMEGLGTIIDGVTGFIGDMTEALKNIDLPDWLTPGSPTPFELGLRGIKGELRDITKTGLPQFSGQLEFSGVGGIDGIVAGQGSMEEGGYNGPSAKDIANALTIALMQSGLGQ